MNSSKEKLKELIEWLHADVDEALADSGDQIAIARYNEMFVILEERMMMESE